ncbi:MAG: hypothetical protein HY331_00360 [Chloroflexi bacterium]|nr:hypothetical protein [Chloroflexota bacterium]
MGFGVSRFWFLVGLLIVLAWPAGALAQNPTPTPDTAFFLGQVRWLPRSNPITGPQEVEGVIRGATGPVAGARVRVRWPGGGAETGSAADGGFKFTLTPGTFQMELLDLPSRPLEFVVAPNLQVRIEFVELREPLAPPTPAQTRQPLPAAGETPGAGSTPTAPAGIRPTAGGTVTATIGLTATAGFTLTATAGVTRTATISAAPTPPPTVAATATPTRTPMPTKTPILTPVPAIGTAVRLLVTPVSQPAEPTPLPRRQSLLPELSNLSISAEPWLSSFLFGGGVGAGLVVVGMIVALLRR